MTIFNELDVVRYTPSSPNGSKGDLAGKDGTIILVHGDPAEAYEIEFIDPAGGESDFVVAKAKELEPVWSG